MSFSLPQRAVLLRLSPQRLSLPRWLRGQTGDTLVEVTIASAIFATVLVTAYNMANLSLKVGLQARERTQASQLAQDQAEKLQLIRNQLVAANINQDTTAIMTAANFPSGARYINNSLAIVGGPQLLDTLYKVSVTLTPSFPAGSAIEGRLDAVITVRWDSIISSTPNVLTINDTLVDTRPAPPVDCSVADTGTCQ